MNTLLIISSVLLTGISQLLFRIGMKDVKVNSIQDVMIVLVSNRYVIGGFIVMMSGALIWFYVLSKNPVSYAYPFVSISFILVIIGGYMMGESINTFKIIGMLCIIIGIVFISQS